uniref:Apple domain-containing protein n=1 Tax=Chromera velia CCMP2878 TaxID=1169474 RepID=A0A0G4F2G8_9ALVE|eukprot:Cvel_2678.t1-p1 / transcript=Cvel_2678.t1 / gene=Cvel_2678 / organism=Chromera_velia_CCMP2878 / gene_product=hypothetical protein / transcript_product=hypothetical protein / location=Cvel_scaffold107:29092-31598(+) / protein_length=509 / sequence_SO=supercontig / SO=protein_coding / is_pseudo=false
MTPFTSLLAFVIVSLFSLSASAVPVQTARVSVDSKGQLQEEGEREREHVPVTDPPPPSTDSGFLQKGEAGLGGKVGEHKGKRKGSRGSQGVISYEGIDIEAQDLDEDFDPSSSSGADASADGGVDGSSTGGAGGGWLGALNVTTDDPDLPNKVGTLACNTRFEFARGPLVNSGELCCDQNNIKRSHDPWSVTNSQDPEVQRVYCQATCAADRDCIGYSFSFTYRSQAECIICSAVPSYETVATGDGNKAECFSGYKQRFDTKEPCTDKDNCYIELSQKLGTRGPQRVGTQCAESSQNNPDHQIIFDFPNPEDKEATEKSGLAETRYPDLCALMMVDRMMNHDKWVYKCSGVQLSGEGTDTQIQCVFADREETPSGTVGGTAVTASTKIVTPLCPILVPEAGDLPANADGKFPLDVAGMTFCEDRTTLPVNITDPEDPSTNVTLFIPFDCNTVYVKGTQVADDTGVHDPKCDPNDVDDNGYLSEKCCSLPLWETEDVLLWFETNKKSASQ